MNNKYKRDSVYFRAEKTDINISETTPTLFAIKHYTLFTKAIRRRTENTLLSHFWLNGPTPAYAA